MGRTILAFLLVLVLWASSASTSLALSVRSVQATAPVPAADSDVALAGAVPQAERVLNVQSYGAAGNGVTDDTMAIQAAIDAAEAAGGGVIFFPPGTWRCQITLDATGVTSRGRYPILQGSGTNGTILQAIEPNAAAIRIVGEGHWRYPYAIRDLRIDGNGRKCDGISVDPKNGVFGLSCENVSFTNCDIGFHNRGLLWYQFGFCTFVGCNFGARLDPSGDSHGGCSYFNGCNFSSNKQAGIYASVSQCTIRDGVVEDNPGFGIYLQMRSTMQPACIENVWFESNGSAGSCIVDGIMHDPADKDVYIAGAGVVRFDRMNFPNVCVDGAIILHASQCVIGDAEYGSYASPDAVVVMKDAVVTAAKTAYSRVSKWYSPGAMIDISTSANEPNAIKQMWRTHPGSNVAWDVTNLWPEGSMAIPFRPGSCAQEYSFVNGGAPIWGQCIKVNLRPNATDYANGVRNLMSTGVLVAKDKWYVFSMDVKTEGQDGYLAVYDRLARKPNRLISGLGHTTNPAMYGYPMWATTDQWRRYVTVRQAPVTGLLDELRLYNPYSTDPNYYIANVQLVEFDTPQSAYEYVQRNAVAPGSWVPRTYLDDEPSTTRSTMIGAAIDNGKIFSNAKARSVCEWDLPPATPGQRYTFIRMASFYMDVDPSGSDYFRPHGRAGDYLRLDTDGDSVTIQCLEAGIWDIVAGYGTYAFES